MLIEVQRIDMMPDPADPSAHYIPSMTESMINTNNIESVEQSYVDVSSGELHVLFIKMISGDKFRIMAEDEMGSLWTRLKIYSNRS
jgi:hypothetical protein